MSRRSATVAVRRTIVVVLAAASSACGGKSQLAVERVARDASMPSSRSDGGADAGLADVQQDTASPAEAAGSDDAAVWDGGPEAEPFVVSSYLANPAHTNAVVDPSLAPPLQAKWGFNAAPWVSYPLIAGGLVYLTYGATASSAHTQLVALDPHSGTTVWGPMDLGAAAIAGHAYDDGRVFTFASTGVVSAYDGATGRPLWDSTPLGVAASGQGAGPPTAYRGLVYFTYGSDVSALDEATGSVRWTAIGAGFDGSSPAVTEEGVFVASDCGGATALDRVVGSVLWTKTCLGGGGVAPAVYQGRVYVSDAQAGNKLVLDARTGALVGSLPCSAPAAFDGNRAYCSESAGLDAIDLPGGGLGWTFPSNALTAFATGDMVYAIDGQLYGIAESTGAGVWSTWAQGLWGSTTASAVGAEGVLIVSLGLSSGVAAYVHAEPPDAGVDLADAGPPVVLVPDDDLVRGLALDATNVYWTASNGGRIRRVAKVGSQPVTLDTSSTDPRGIAVDATSIYWTTPNFSVVSPPPAVMTMPLGGGVPATLAVNQASPIGIVVSATTVYFTLNAPGVVSVPIAGGSEVTLATRSNVSGIAIDATNLYWSTADGTYFRPLSGGVVSTLGPPATAVAVDGEALYYVATSPFAQGTVGRVPLAGGTPTILASGRPPQMLSVAVDDRNVYWMEGGDSPGALAAVPKAGGRVSVLAGQLSDPEVVAVDDTGIYFGSAPDGGAIGKVPK